MLTGSNGTVNSPQRPRGRTADSIDLPRIKNQTPDQHQDERGVRLTQTPRPYSTERIKLLARSKTQQSLAQPEEVFPGIAIKSEADLFPQTFTRIHHSSSPTEFSPSSFISIFSAEIGQSKSVSAQTNKQTEYLTPKRVRRKTSRTSPPKGSRAFTLGKKFSLGTDCLEMKVHAKREHVFGSRIDWLRRMGYN